MAKRVPLTHTPACMMLPLLRASHDTDHAIYCGAANLHLTACRPQPWMTMTRQLHGQESSAPAASLHHQTSHHPSSARSASPDASSATDSMTTQHDPQSADPIPFSEGLFGRQRAAKRKAVPAQPPQHVASTSDRQGIHRSLTADQPAAEAHQAQHAVQQALVALDRVNARRRQTASAAAAPAAQPQRHLDALDRFNASKGHPPQTAAAAPAVGFSGAQSVPHRSAALFSSSTAHRGTDSSTSHRGTDQSAPSKLAQGQAHWNGPMGAYQHPPAPPSHHTEAHRPFAAQDRRQRSCTSDASLLDDAAAGDCQGPFQQAGVCRGAAQRPLDGLDRFNARKHRSKASTPASRSAVGGPVPVLTRTDAAREDAANDSQQSQTTFADLEQVSCLPAGRAAAAAANSSMATHTPDALDRVNSILMARRDSRKPSSARLHRSSASPEATESSTQPQTDTHMQPTAQAALGGENAEAIDSHTQARVTSDQGRADSIPQASVVGLRSAAAWRDDGRKANVVNGDNLVRQLAAEQASVAKHKRMRSFDSDSDGQSSQAKDDDDVTKRSRSSSRNASGSRGMRSGQVVQTANVFKRLG